MALGRKVQILIVDDEDALRGLLVGELVKSGYDVTEADDGDVALEKLKKRKFDIVFLDINMPRMNGIDVLKVIHKQYFGTKVIILTAFADLRVAMEAKEFGAVDFICKPFNLSDVTTAIKNFA